MISVIDYWNQKVLKCKLSVIEVSWRIYEDLQFVKYDAAYSPLVRLSTVSGPHAPGWVDTSSLEFCQKAKIAHIWYGDKRQKNRTQKKPEV